MLRTRRPVLVGAFCCAAVAGCTSTSRAPASLPCGDDRGSGQVVAAYRAMLGDPVHPDAAGATHLYVWTTLTNGAGLGTSAGVMSDAIKHCLSGGVAGLPPISLVYGRDDPSIPTASSAGGPIPSFVGHVAFVSFGDVVVVGSKATSSVTVDKGGGDEVGGEYVLKMGDSGATIISSNVRWAS